MPPTTEIAKVRPLQTGMLLATASLPCLLSILPFAIGSTASEAAQGAKRPALAFDQYLVNFGDHPPDPQRFVFARFRFQNRSDRTAVITQLKPSCGCLSPQLEKRTYRPGESGEFFLRVQTANETAGPKEYFVTLLYEDPQPREVTLSLKAVLPEQKVVLRPKALIFYQLGTAPTTQEITLTDYRGEGLNLTGVESSSKLVQAELQRVDRDAEGNRRLHIAVTIAGRVPPGRQRALVTLLTDDPVYSRLRLPLLIQGPKTAPSLERPAGPHQPRRQSAP